MALCPAIDFPKGIEEIKTPYYLADASMEADVAKGRRDWAFSERDKVSPIVNNVRHHLLILF